MERVAGIGRNGMERDDRMTLRVAQLLPTLGVGGAEKLQVTLAIAARERPLDVTMIVLADATSGSVPDALRTLGVQVVELPGRNLRDVRRFRSLVQHLNDARYDVVQSHLTTANILVAVAGRLTSTPTIATLHSVDGSPLFYRGQPPRFPLARWVFETLALRFGVSRVVAVGHGVAAAHARRVGGRKIEVIPNAVMPSARLTTTERVELRRELSSNPSGPLVISVGRVVAAKGFHDLIDAFARVAVDRPDARLVVVGDGSLRRDLESRIVALGLDDIVRLAGSRNDVPRLLAAADLYVSASHWEGLPISILEAMSAGLPVVGTQVGDVPQVVVPGTGTVVPPGRPELLASAIVDMLNDPVRMQAAGRTARCQTEQAYALDVWMDRLIVLYEDVSGTRVRPRV